MAHESAARMAQPKPSHHWPVARGCSPRAVTIIARPPSVSRELSAVCMVTGSPRNAAANSAAMSGYVMESVSAGATPTR